MAGELPSIARFLQDAALPEGAGHRVQPHRGEEVLGLLKHDLWCPALAEMDLIVMMDLISPEHGSGDIEVRFARVGLEDVPHVRPLLGPHVAQEVRWQGPLVPHFAGILSGQLVSHVRVQLLVQRLQSLPGPLHLLDECARLVRVNLHQGSVLEPVHSCCLIVEVNVLVILCLDIPTTLLSPLLPVVLQLLWVSAAGHDLGQLGLQAQQLGGRALLGHLVGETVTMAGQDRAPEDCVNTMSSVHTIT